MCFWGFERFIDDKIVKLRDEFIYCMHHIHNEADSIARSSFFQSICCPLKANFSSFNFRLQI